MNDERFTLLYDGQCPMCSREIAWLKRRDRKDRLLALDISEPAFDAQRYGLAQDEVEAIIHGVMPDGRVVRRVEAIAEAYKAVGLGWIVAPFAWPGISWLADKAYAVFARNRVAIGRLMGRKCEGTCSASASSRSS